MKKLHFEPIYSVADGIAEIVNALSQNVFQQVAQRKNFYENHEIVYC